MSAEKQYPLLSQHRIAKPCKVKWTDMSGDEKKRYCGQCKLSVYNLSSMTSAEAEGLLKKSNGRICTYFYQRTDGTVLTQDCPVGLRQVYRKQGALAAAMYGLSLLIALPLGRASEPMPGEPETGDAYYPTPQMLGGAPPIMGEAVAIPQATPSPTPTPTAAPRSNVSPKIKNCPRPLMGKPAAHMGRAPARK